MKESPPLRNENSVCSALCSHLSIYRGLVFWCYYVRPNWLLIAFWCKLTLNVISSCLTGRCVRLLCCELLPPKKTVTKICQFYSDSLWVLSLQLACSRLRRRFLSYF